MFDGSRLLRFCCRCLGMGERYYPGSEYERTPLLQPHSSTSV